MAVKPLPRKNNPRYDPHVPPTSKLPGGLPSCHTLYTYIKVGNRESSTSTTPARYFAKITCKSVRGRVKRSSMVPVRLSSEKDRMVMAGTKNMKTQGAT